jgi:voltage-gated potassium channel Kch
MLTEISIAAVIVCVCLLVHVAAMLFMADWLLRKREYFLQFATRRHYSLVIIAVFAGIILLHLAEATHWALFYYSRNLFSDFETSLYFSLVSFGTIGYGDVLLPQKWRLLGAIEGISGILLCGVSTAFIFAIVNAMFQLRIQQQSSRL